VARQLSVLHDLASRRWWLIAIAAVALVGVELLFASLSSMSTLYRSDFDVLSLYMASPAILIAPFVASALGASRMFSEVGNRYIVSARMRSRPSRYFGAKIAAAGIVAGLIAAPLPIAGTIVAFAVWPAIGDPNVEPTQYGLTPASALADAAASTTYSQLLLVSPLVYSVLYSLWVAFAAAVFAALTLALLILLRNRAVALVIPLGLYLGETVAAAVLGDPTYGLVYSIFPFGLTQSSILAGASPVLVLALAVVVIWVFIIRRARHLQRLS